MEEQNVEWNRYGRTLVAAMQNIIETLDNDNLRLQFLETADFWLSMGIAMAIREPQKATRLLEIIEAHEEGRKELEEDALDFLSESLGEEE